MNSGYISRKQIEKAKKNILKSHPGWDLSDDERSVFDEIENLPDVKLPSVTCDGCISRKQLNETIDKILDSHPHWTMGDEEQEILDAIEKLPDAEFWHEGCPKKPGEYMCTLEKNGIRYVDWISVLKNKTMWKEETFYFKGSWVIDPDSIVAYRSKPEPYGGDKNE